MSVPVLRFKDNDGRDFPEWETETIGSALAIGSGKDYKHLSSGDIPVYGTGGYMLSVNNYLYDGESVCIGRKGTIDRPTLLNGKFWTVDTLFYTHSFKNCLPKFIYATFQRIDWKNYNEASGVPSLSKSTIEKIEIHLPSIAEQTKIANFLTAVDEKIHHLTQKHDLLAQYKNGVMQQIFSQELRFKDDDGRDFPEWNDLMISELNLYISDGNYGEQYPTSAQMVSSGVPFIRANNIKEQKLVWDDMKYITPDHHKILTSGHLLPNDILITTRGEIGTVALVQDEFGGSNINAQICLLRVKETNELAPEYLIQVLTTNHCQKQFKELQTGSALKQLPKSSLGKVSIKLPCLKEQTKIANFLTAIDDKITATQTQLQAVKQYKQGLLQQMFI